jgi:uncharacterized protein DUF6675
MNKLTTIILLLIISIFNISADESIFDFLSISEKETLETEAELSRYFFKKELPLYLFPTTFNNEFQDNISKLDITIGVESLYFINYSDNQDLADNDMLSIYNTLLSIKTMKGIEYYSKSRKKMRTLFTESYAVESLENLTVIEDPVFDSIPYLLNRYLLQTDKTFGENLYRTVYKYDGSTIWINMTNETKMKYSFIPMVAPGNMSVNLFITTTEEGIIFYGVTTAETFSVLGLAKAKKESFYNRIKAMFNWFSDQMDNY